MSVILSREHLIAGPAVEPLSLDFVKKQRRFTSSSLDSLFDLWISTARQYFERQTSRQLITATWEYWLTSFPYQGSIELPRPPLQSVVSITYDDANGDEQTIDSGDYKMIAPSGDYCSPGHVTLNSGSSWPSHACPSVGLSRSNALRIRYKAGYGNADTDVPAIIRSCLLNIVGDCHKYGEDTQEFKGTIARLPWIEQTIYEFKVSSYQTLNPKTSSERVWRV